MKRRRAEESCEERRTKRGSFRVHNPNRNVMKNTVQDRRVVPCIHGCGKFFVSKHGMARHVESVHLKIKYGCEQCDKKFASKATMLRHVDRVHSGIITNYACHECGSRHRSQRALNNHRLRHVSSEGTDSTSSTKLFVSTATTRETKTSEAATRTSSHEPVVCIPKNVPATISCRYSRCSVKCTSRHDMMIHVDECHPVSEYTCSRCNATFTKGYLCDQHAAMCVGSNQSTTSKSSDLVKVVVAKAQQKQETIQQRMLIRQHQIIQPQELLDHKQLCRERQLIRLHQRQQQEERCKLTSQNRLEQSDSSKLQRHMYYLWVDNGICDDDILTALNDPYVMHLISPLLSR